MWLMVQFDLPVETADERRAYNRFRKDLFRLGFTMHQKSIYLRWEDTDERGTHTASLVHDAIPKVGNVAVFRFSSRTMDNSLFYHDQTISENPRSPCNFVLL